MNENDLENILFLKRKIMEAFPAIYEAQCKVGLGNDLSFYINGALFPFVPYYVLRALLNFSSEEDILEYVKHSGEIRQFMFAAKIKKGEIPSVLLMVLVCSLERKIEDKSLDSFLDHSVKDVLFFFDKHIPGISRGQVLSLLPQKGLLMRSGLF